MTEVIIEAFGESLRADNSENFDESSLLNDVINYHDENDSQKVHEDETQNDHNYEQKRFKSDHETVSSSLTEPMTLMSCQSQSKFDESHQTASSGKNLQIMKEFHAHPQYQNFVSPKSIEVHEHHPKYQTSEDSGEWSSLSPSIESCEDENSFTEPQQNYKKVYHQPQNQAWQYQNYYAYGQQPQYQNYGYNYYQEPATISYVQPPSNMTCEVCVRTFKTSSNLTRHLASKTHLKKLASKKKTKPSNFCGSDVSFAVAKKCQGSVTDISDEERKILWKIDDEIFEFLNQLEREKSLKKIEIFPTPPLSPSGGKGGFKK